MKNVLWISRHTMTGAQLDDLCRYAGGEVEVDQYPDTVKSVSELADRISGADIICAVLPIEMLAELLPLAGDRPVLVAKSARVRVPGQEGGEPQFAFCHAGWYRMLEVVVRQERV